MRKLLYVVLVLAIIAGLTYWYVFHKPHRDLQNEAVAYTLTAEQLVQQFSQDRPLADSLYIDQLIALNGVISEVKDRSLILYPGVYGSLDSTETMPEINVGDSVLIRGRVLSYDELFEEVKLDYVQFEN